jgi:hypothetical protein
MKNIDNESRLLASLAVFRELYDSKKEVYGIIAEFIKEIIISKAKHQFNIREITQLLNSDYEFNIPEAVVNTSLKQLDFLAKSDGLYNVTDIEGIKESEINERREEVRNSNNHLINKLYLYIETEINKELNDNEKEIIVSSFCSFLLDDESNKQEYINTISAFFIINSSDVDFIKQINTIKEGVILYSGIKYSDSSINIGTWDTFLTIYIDTEVLFYFAGYDGAVYKTLVDDFLSFVNEINQNSSKKLINLLYFNDVTIEIDKFFAKAEQIASGKEKLDPSRPAMASICNGCKTASDVVAKKTAFFELLKKNDIIEDDYTDYFIPSNHKYNISDQTTIDKVAKSLDKKDISEHLRFLNFIRIHRADSISNNFENIGYILLSGNTLTQKVAWHDEIKKNGIVPLVTNLKFITNKFWFKLNKGFGKNNYPKSFDIITKAQIVLSSQLNASVGLQYSILQEKFKNEELTEEEAVATIANLRKQSKKPEEIDENNLSNVLDSISEDKIEKYILEQEHFKSEALRESQANAELREDIVQKQKKLDEYKKSQLELSSKIIETKEALLSEKNSSIDILQKQKKPIDIEITNKFRIFKWKIFSTIIISYVIAYFLIWKYGWNELEQWTWIISVSLPIIIAAIYMLFKESTLNPIKLLKSKKHRIQIKKYNQFNFDILLLKKLKIEVNDIRDEIVEIKASTQQ